MVILSSRYLDDEGCRAAEAKRRSTVGPPAGSEEALVDAATASVTSDLTIWGEYK